MSLFKTARWNRWSQDASAVRACAAERKLPGAGTFFISRDRSDGAYIEVDRHRLINFSSYDYLGLTQHPAVLAASHAALDRFGSSASASRIVAGQTAVHDALDERIARFLGCEAAITFNSGFATNASTIGFLFDQHDLVIHDNLMHQSGLEGIRLSGAQRLSFRHNDVAALEAVLKREAGKYRKVLVLVEGAYSMDGDICPLAEIVALKERYGFYLMVDEAHSLGTLGASGRGIGEHANVKREDVDLWMGTLSKSLASCGGYIAGGGELIEYLRSNCPAYVFSAAMPPVGAAAAEAALGVIEAEPERVRQLQARVREAQSIAFGLRLNIGSCEEAPILPVMLGDRELALAASFALYHRGVCAHPLIYPAVPKGLARLRFFITALHSADEIRQALEAVAAVVREAEAEGPQAPAGALASAAAALSALAQDGADVEAEIDAGAGASVEAPISQWDDARDASQEEALA
jgi:8-amino-7-oxononanoate synthase